MRLIFLLIWTLSLEAYEYQRLQLSYFTTAHILVVDPKVDVLKLVTASERTPVPELVRQEGAAAGINGGFFHADGTPALLLKIEKEWLQLQNRPAGALGFSKGGEKVLIDQVHTQQGMRVRVIPVSGRTTSAEWEGMNNIVGGTPLLVSSGEIVRSHPDKLVSKPFYHWRHPRTAVGVRENGQWVLAVVDGRVWNYFGGMTIPELAQFMQRLGCVEALNLDGGGSSIMVVEGEVVSEPADGAPDEGRPVKDALLVISSAPPSFWERGSPLRPLKWKR